jgi:hypothetical protein
VTHSWLEIDQDGSGDVSGVVALVVEDIFPVAALGCEVLEVAVLADSVLLTKLLPKLAANYTLSAERDRRVHDFA